MDAATCSLINVFPSLWHNANHPLQALRLKPAFDVEFLSYASRRKQEGSHGRNGSMSMMHKLAFDKNLLDARRAVLGAAQAQRSFWAKMQEPKPSLSKLQGIAGRYAYFVRNAQHAFAELYALSSASVPVLRLHAQFSDICNDNDRSAALAAEADRIEDSRSRVESNGSYFAATRNGLSLRLLQEVESDLMAVSTRPAQLLSFMHFPTMCGSFR